MKILFLDVDGVLNSEQTFFRTKGERDDGWLIDPYMALLVARIVEATGCEIVMSSSWRHHPEGVKRVEKRVWKILDTTPSIPTSREEREECDRKGLSHASLCERGKEIQAWLDKHPEVTKYAILDDDSDMLPEQKPSFFKTQWKVGLTDEIANAVIAHLNS